MSADIEINGEIVVRVESDGLMQACQKRTTIRPLGWSCDGFQVGDIVKIGWEPFKRRITGILDSGEYAMDKYIRPSKGYRRHVRRIKAKG